MMGIHEAPGGTWHGDLETYWGGGGVMTWINRAHHAELLSPVASAANATIAGNIEGSFKESRAGRLSGSILARHARVVAFLSRYSIAMLRVALAVIFIWFGALKLTGSTPVAELVRNSVPFIAPPGWLVPALGGFELAIGICLLLGAALPVVLPLFMAHMAATFSVLVTQPGIAFTHGDPLLLTVVGEFVVKNLVLLAAGIAVCTWRPIVAAARPQIASREG
jgi:uncharacterized membrane protein YkgB